jgi:hypothetical protein
MKVLNFKEMESYWGKGNKSKFFVFALLFIMIVTGFYACKKNDTDSLDKNISYKAELKTYLESQDTKIYLHNYLIITLTDLQVNFLNPKLF